MYNHSDNIVALASAPGLSAVNLIRCSGPETINIIKKFLVGKHKKIKPNYCHYVSLVSPKNKKIIDKCVIACYFSPKSYTGQNVVEISTHGGPIIYKLVIKELLDAGCRIAEPGEFTFRAFTNGKIDLIQAESISNIINGESGINTEFSIKNLAGELSAQIKKIISELKSLITYIEHELDFSEDEITHKKKEYYIKRIKKILKKIKTIKDGSFVSKNKGADYLISITGKPNAGKSSLFNLLVGHERSIVTNISGTTRDTVDVFLNIKGLSVQIVDTAGLRNAKNKIEVEGIKRTLEVVEKSNCLIVVDEENPKEILKKFNLNQCAQDVIFVKNKTDLSGKSQEKTTISVSCKEKTGINNLLAHLSTLINNYKNSFLRDNSYIVSKRVLALLAELEKNTEKALYVALNENELAILASFLRSSLESFNVVGEGFKKDEIINSIFKDFCVGK